MGHSAKDCRVTLPTTPTPLADAPKGCYECRNDTNNNNANNNNNNRARAFGISSGEVRQDTNIVTGTGVDKSLNLATLANCLMLPLLP